MKSLAKYSFVVMLVIGVLVRPTKLESANLVSTKDLLSTSRLSVLGTVDPTGTAAGSSNVKLITPAYDPGGAAAIRNTVTTSNIKVGDVLSIGSSVDYYTVVTIVDSLNFTVSPVLLATDDDANDPIYLRVRPTHTFTFTTASAVLNGSFRIMLPADADGATVWTDGVPDDGGFDFTAAPTVTGTDTTGYTFSAGTGTVSAGSGCTTPALYHCYDVAYTGVGAIGASISIAITGAAAPIAPAPNNSTQGTAETYQYIVQNLTAGGVAVDTTSGKVALIEPVRVTATVDPTISMTICGDTDCADTLVNPGDTVDGEILSSNAGATSNATSVALGVLDLLAPRLQAQEVAVATNGAGGYVLTAKDDGDMRRLTDTINDNVTPPTGPAVLNTVGTEAYGIHPSGADVTTGTWGTGSAAANKYSGTDATTAVTLASNAGPTAAVTTFITYKANISPITPQGDYAHSIYYIATATF